MRQSQLFTKTFKSEPKDEVSPSARVLLRAGYVDKLMAGVYTLLPLGLKVFKKIEQIIREEMDAIGGQELYMPTLQPKESWQATGRWEGLDVLFRFRSHYTKTEYVLGPTHEEVVSPLVKKFVSSYKDLPVAAYHIQNKFRDEKRAKSGLLRGREFIMKDMYSFHTDQPDLDRFYELAKGAYTRIFDRTGIGRETYLTYASGGTFSKYSHEFQTLTKAGEDLIHICDRCRLAVNREILADLGNACPECQNRELREEKAVEVGNIFKLGTKYSEPFDLTYTDRRGGKQPVVMGCYGIGLQRLLGTIAEVSLDKKGLNWPEAVAPFRVHLLLIGDEDGLVAAAGQLYDRLRQAGVETLFDDRVALGAGVKFNDADLIGCPLRLVVSEKTIAAGGVELKRRAGGEAEVISNDEIFKRLSAEKK